eukprot:8038576-Heterocapsa_arctica.AAC.1
MNLDQLMETRRVKTLDGTIFTILPWARNLNDSRCTYCSKPDRRDLLGPATHCVACSSPLKRAQD